MNVAHRLAEGQGFRNSGVHRSTALEKNLRRVNDAVLGGVSTLRGDRALPHLPTIFATAIAAISLKRRSFHAAPV